MTTATRTKTSKDGLQKVREAEAAWVAAKDADHAASAKHADLLRRHQELQDNRRQLVHRQPELVDHQGVPVGPDNPVGEIDQAIAALGDLDDSAARVDHARQVERAKRQSYEAVVANNAEAMRQETYIDDEALRSSFTEAMTKAHEIAKQRVDVCKRLMSIYAACQESNRSVQIDAVADVERQVRRLAEQPLASAGGE